MPNKCYSADNLFLTELQTITENCRIISEQPPQNFYQALQLTYFVQLVLKIESNGHSVSLGRLDQYLFPFYQKDKIAVPGKWGYRCTGMNFLNFMRVFLTAMYNGLDKQSGKVFHNGTVNYPDFESFNDVFKAWQHQIKYYTQKTVEIDTATDTALEENVVGYSAFSTTLSPDTQNDIIARTEHSLNY